MTREAKAFPKLNRRLFKTVRDRVAKAIAEQKFDMRNWGVLHDPKHKTWVRDSSAGCGTTACIAGWTILESARVSSIPKTAYQLGYTEYPGYCGGNNHDCSMGETADEAAKLLGLTPEQARMLFYIENWPQGRRDEVEMQVVVADRVKEGKKAMFLMDEMLAGRDPWEDG